MAKILQFPNGGNLKTVRKRRPPSLDLVRYFDDPSVSFETLKRVYKHVACSFHRRQKLEREREWSS